MRETDKEIDREIEIERDRDNCFLGFRIIVW